ncbi:MAG TPA: formate dehydrogenase subunit alpha [Dissulfurispiraceae bacterium]|nr:formate dehydrogenase subunit alpha [Dissulfurispiraceae bacterium]
MITLRIDGASITVPAGETVLEAARRLNIRIPTLCHHPELTPSGGCRLCIVQIEGVPRPVTSCTTPVSEGMVVTTASPELEALRKTVLELILSDHPNDCMTCEGAGSCELQNFAYDFGIRCNPHAGERRRYEKRDGNPFIERQMEKCILCGRCVKVCTEVQGVGAVNFTYRGFKSKICPPFERDLDCEFCGQCITVCPTGALSGKQWAGKGRTMEVRAVRSVCGYCGVGCEITLHVANNRIIRITSPSDSWNDGWLCVKGMFGYGFVESPERLTSPLIRKNGALQEASWDEALSVVAGRLRDIKLHYGADSIAGLSSARCTTEENYVFQKFMRTVIGTNNVDHCARLCHAPSAAGLDALFGSGAMTNSIAEIPAMEMLFIIGSNTKETHPVIANRMIEARRNGAKIVIADPRRVPMVRFADLHLQLKPGTDAVLLNGIAHVILKEKLFDADFISQRTDGFEAWRTSVEAFAPEAISDVTGVPAASIIATARLYGSSRKAGIFFAMGITQHSNGTDNVLAIANLALLTGNIGRPHTGINPLRGQNNVQGASDAGALPDVFPGYQSVRIPENRAKFEQAWHASLSDRPGLTLTEMMPAALKGDLKALYIMGENPVVTDPNMSHTVEALDALEFLVVQDIFLTETARLADVVLPAACFAEKNGTFTNTERKVQRVRQAVNAPGAARNDLAILIDLSSRLGFDMCLDSPESAFAEFSSLWPVLGGITYRRLEGGGLQWPCPDAQHPGTPYLYAQGFPRRKAVFSRVRNILTAEATDEAFPFVLTTGRNLFQYHAGSMTRRVQPIEVHAGTPYAEINDVDAARLGISNGEPITVSSRRGRVEVAARILPGIAEGVVFIPMHYCEAAVNLLTSDAFDRSAKTPAFKACSVSIKKSGAVKSRHQSSDCI